MPSSFPRSRPGPLLLPAGPAAALVLAVLVGSWGLLLLAPGSAAAQQAAPADTVASDPPVPQVFDWHLERVLPAQAVWGQALDTAYARDILSWTTEPDFTNPLVDHLPLADGVPTPADHFGYAIGRPGILHTTAELHGWYEALAEASPRVEMSFLGESEEGRPFALVKVGSEENLARLDEIRAAYHRLTEPRETSEEEMEALIEDLPAIYMVFSGLHSPETGHPEVTAELAYRLAVSEQPMLREIREGAILFLMPVTDPDGRDRVVEWYRLHDQDQAYTSDDRVPGPPFWGQYIRHDNNRDGLQLTLALSRQVVALFEEWKYPIALDLHESVPFLYVSTGTGPYNPNIDPITRHEWQWIAHHEVSQLTALGMPGVWTHDFFDGWNPGYMVFALNNRNAIGRFYETYGNSVPATQERTVGSNRTSVEWFRANPPWSEVTWSLRNNVNYAQSGVLHSMHLIARNRDEVLRNYWRKNRNAVRRGVEEPPHAWVVPARQARRADVGHMLNLLLDHGVELHVAGEAFTPEDWEEAGVPPAAADVANGLEVAPGDYVLRADQPYGNFLRNLMERQEFPANAPRPYDDVAWTFPLLHNVTTRAVNDPAILEVSMEAVEGPVHLPGRIHGDADGAEWWAIRHDASAHALEARWALGTDVPVYTSRDPIPEWDGASEGGGEGAGPAFARGAWLIPGDALPAEELEAWVEERGLEARALAARDVEGLDRHLQTLPRIALLHSWRNTQDDGAVRWTLDSMEIPYTYLPEDRLAEGGLRDRFDVILFPDQGRNATARQIFEGLDPADGPLAWEPHPDYPALGAHSRTHDMTGGMGYEGLMALRDFVMSGGTLLALGSAATLPVEFAMARGVSLRSPGGLFSPGSIVEVETDGGLHPITWGYEEAFPAFDRFGPYLSVSGDRSDDVALRFAPADRVFMSGLVEGPGQLARQPAVVSLALGEGRLVLYGVRVLHRNQTRGSFALAWNAILNWDRLEPVEGGDEDETSR
ncbi:MAG: hypothetical protein EA352_04260 [Gemmatimonadales bacterium]|nr:MAG: hypothetical protein EA352_04260 [Gemmatimonadales bacterium]